MTYTPFSLNSERPVLRPWWKPRDSRCLWAVLLAPALLLNACGKPTYPAAQLPQTIEELCRREHQLDVRARLVGHTLYVSCDLPGLVSRDLGFQQDMLEKFEDVMLSGTRASLSTNAKVDYLVVEATDPRLSARISLIRYIPDIKGLIYMRYSRADFENRLIFETEMTKDQPSSETRWHDVTRHEFIARLVASRLHRQITQNPLVSVFLQIQRITGDIERSTLVLTLELPDDVDLKTLKGEVFTHPVLEVTQEVLKKYDEEKTIQDLLIRTVQNKVLLKTPVHQIKNLLENSAAPS